MNRNTVLALVVLSLFAGLPAHAADGEMPDEGFKAQALKEACAPSSAPDQNARDAAGQVCLAYLRGLADGLFMLGAVQHAGVRLCLPTDGPVSPAEAKSELEDYLAGHPDAAGHSAGVAATFAIIAAHPCE